MSEHVFNLAHPFEYRGAQYIEFKARRPKVRDLRNFIKNVDKDSVAAMEKVLADLCEIDEKIIAEIDIEDFGPMKKWFEGFLKPMLGELEQLLSDAFPIFERFGWTLGDVEDLEWVDFCMVADGVAELNRRDAEARVKARGGR